MSQRDVNRHFGMVNIPTYEEVAEDGVLIGFYFQVYDGAWIAFSTIDHRPVMLGFWARDLTADARIRGYFSETRKWKAVQL